MEHQDFCDHFVKRVTKTNRLELLHRFRFHHFGDQANKGRIEISCHCSVFENILNKQASGGWKKIG